MQLRHTKTFTQTRYHRRKPGGAPSEWEALPAPQDEPSLDQQVAEWVTSTGAIILHPGQLGIHTSWGDQEMSLKCIMFGLTVLYMKPEAIYAATREAQQSVPWADPDGTDPGSAVYPPVELRYTAHDGGSASHGSVAPAQPAVSEPSTRDLLERGEVRPDNPSGTGSFPGPSSRHRSGSYD